MLCRIVPENIKIEVSEKESLFMALNRENIGLLSPCGGKGICGKCAIRIVKGTLPITAEDRRFFNEEKLKEGYRLACVAHLTEDITVEIISSDKDLAKASSHIYGLENVEVMEDARDVLAVDIGTTTIAFALVSADNKKVLKTCTMTNHQRAYGADVISRIVAAGEGHADELTNCVKKDISTGIHAVLDGLKDRKVSVVITGNTTMEHLLLGYDVSGLGIYPFTPVSVETYETDWKSLFGNDEFDMDITVMPGFTTYVGADILAGVQMCGMLSDSKNTLLVDLGTNGEMALAAGDKLYITSTAAGPAFEGGNISCGMPGVDGAVSELSLENGEFVVKTINDKKPEGICGSGIIDAIACMLENEILDETGLLDDDYFDDGVELVDKVVLTQKDVREMQLAKSAVRAGIETLIKRAELKYDDIDALYLAGGFGQYINIESAVKIGLLPVELKDKIRVVGNTALGGAVKYGLMADAHEKALLLKEKAEEIDLSKDSLFQEGYMTYIMFDAE